MRVLFFGRLRDIAGAAMLTPEQTFATVGSLRQWLAGENADLARALDHSSVRVAVDQQIVGGDAPLAGAREVAFMPPMSGG